VNGKESRSAEFFTVVSTVGQIFGAKRRNSAQRGENRKWLKYLASATAGNAAEICAKSLS
jgi:hypothetical protein